MSGSVSWKRFQCMISIQQFLSALSPKVSSVVTAFYDTAEWLGLEAPFLGHTSEWERIQKEMIKKFSFREPQNCFRRVGEWVVRRSSFSYKATLFVIKKCRRIKSILSSSFIKQHKMCRFLCSMWCSCWASPLLFDEGEMFAVWRRMRCDDAGEGRNLFSTLSSSAFHYDIYCSLLLSLLLQFILVISWYKKIKEKAMKQQQERRLSMKRKTAKGGKYNILLVLPLFKICVCAYL